MSLSIDIVIVNWNAGPLLKECLLSVAAGSPPIHVLKRVVVVDNASADDSLSGLNDVHLPLTIIHNDVNRGFGAACNQGAAGSTADLLLFLNPDTRLQPDTLARSALKMAQSDMIRVAVLGIRMNDDAGHAMRSCARFPSAHTFFFRSLGLSAMAPRVFPDLLMTEWDHTDSQDVDHVIGAFYLVRREAFEHVSGFDERFFVYLEDLDLSARLRTAGGRIFYCADICAYHKGGGTSDKIKATRLFYSLRSRILYAAKHFGPVRAAAVAVSTLCVEPFTRGASALIRRDIVALRETCNGYRALWRDLPNVLRTAHK